MKKALVFLALFLTLISFGFSTNYYISKIDGNDSYTGLAPAYVSGTNGPWLTLAKAVATIASGSTVYLRAGTWNEQLYFPPNLPGYAATTTFKNHTGETPVIDMVSAGTGAAARGIYVDHCNYVRVEGITVRNSGNMAIRFESSDNCSLVSCTTEHSRLSGIYFLYCDNFDVSYNSVKWSQCTSGSHDHAQWSGWSEECISIGEESNYGDVHHNSISHGSEGDYGGEGLNIKNGCSYIYVHHNTVDQARDDSVESTRFCMGVDGWTTETHHIYFYNNIVKNGSWGIQFNSEEGGYTHHIYAWNNIVIHCGHSAWHGGGIGMPNFGSNPGKCDYCYFWNNTVFDCYYGARFVKTNIGAPIEVINNILDNCESSPIYFDGGVNQDLITRTNNLTDASDPHFLNEGAFDFHLTSASTNCINQGTTVSGPSGYSPNVSVDYDGTGRPNGAAPDIGAYEYIINSLIRLGAGTKIRVESGAKVVIK